MPKSLWFVAAGLPVALSMVVLILARRNVRVRPEHAYPGAVERFENAGDLEERCDALIDACKAQFAAGRYDVARAHARALLGSVEHCFESRSYGNAIHDGNMVLGRVALKEGDASAAARYLLRAGAAPSSPTLATFGPNMSLARDLLEQGDSVTVLRYFALVRRFWILGSDTLDEWEGAISKGRIPKFGANLDY